MCYAFYPNLGDGNMVSTNMHRDEHSGALIFHPSTEEQRISHLEKEVLELKDMVSQLRQLLKIDK